MAKVIIGIHGLGNKPSKEILKEWWSMSLIEGLHKIDPEMDMPRFEIIYWADILHEEPLNEQIKDKKSPIYLEEKYVPGKGEQLVVNHDMRKKFLDWYDEAADKIFLNEDMTVNYSFISDNVIHSYFKDLEAYYINKTIRSDGTIIPARDEIRNKVMSELKKYEGDDIFLIAHSMGSIIAFDILTFYLPNLKIDTFATLGSPLGIPFVRSKIALEQNEVLHAGYKLKTPPEVNKWYNFSDLEDMVAINYSLKDDFDTNGKGVKAIDFIVNNDYEINKVKNPHKSFGYLRTKEFSNILIEFIERKEERFIHKVKRFLKIKRKTKD